jgi:hypothetical protein
VFVGVAVGASVGAGVSVGGGVSVGVEVGPVVLVGTAVGRSVAVAVPVTVAEPVTVTEGVNVLVAVLVGRRKDVPVGYKVEDGSFVWVKELSRLIPLSGVGVHTSGNCLKVAVVVGNFNIEGSSLGG